MLALVGIGLSNKGITLEGLEMLKRADLVYYEDYTNTMDKGIIEELQSQAGKKFERLDRSGMEEDSNNLLEGAKKGTIAICVSGDPLSATTHISLLVDAKRFGVETKVIHGPSIMTAVGEAGLQLYKFGRTVTLPKEGSLDSIHKFIKKNRSVDLHTLVLLDIGMTANKAIELLLEKEKLGEVVVIARAGSASQGIFYGKATELKQLDFGSPPHCLIIPSKRHFVEEEALERWKIQEKQQKKKSKG